MTDKDFERYRQGAYIKNEINIVDVLLKRLSAGGYIYIEGFNIEKIDISNDIKKIIRKGIIRDLKCHRDALHHRFYNL